MRRVRLLTLSVLVLLIALVVVACGSAGDPEPAAEDGTTDDAPAFGNMSPEEQRAAREDVPVDSDLPDFGGVDLTVVGDAGHNMNPFGFWAPEWENAGINIRVVEVPFSDLYSREKAEFVAGSGAFDIAIFYPAYLGDFASNGYLAPLDDMMAKHDPRLDDVIPAYRELYLTWEGQTYALPYDGDVLNFYYRKDLLEHPDEQAAFEEQYGRELTVPATWKEYLEVGEFFTREAGDTLAGETLERPFYGCAEYGQRGFSFAWFMNRFASKGGIYFDEQMVPQINSAAAVEALENMKQAVDTCSPPDVLNYGYDQLRDIFINGDAFMVVQWSDVPKKAADPEQSEVVGKVGYAPVPGWEMEDGTINRRAMMPVGRVIAVTADSDNPEAAYWVAKYLSEDRSLFGVSTSLTGLDPYRYSHIDPAAYPMFEDEADAEAYLNNVVANLEIGYPEIYIPGAAQYQEALDLAVNKTLAGQMDAQAALDEAAAEWDGITENLGKERQTELWNSALDTYRELGLYD